MSNSQMKTAVAPSAPVERTSPMPAWGQVLRDLRHRIDSGELVAGSRLPTENELAEQYEVSRITIRRALAHLANDGYIDRVHGTGTFVSNRAAPVHHDLLLGGSWRERLESEGHSTHSEVIAAGVVPDVPARVAAALADAVQPFELQGPFVHLERVQYVDSRPVGLSKSWLPHELVPGLDRSPLVDGSLSRALAANYGIGGSWVDNRLLVDQADAHEANVLDSYVDVPLFVVMALNRQSDMSLLEYSRTVWLASRVRFRAVRDSR